MLDRLAHGLLPGFDLLQEFPHRPSRSSGVLHAGLRQLYFLIGGLLKKLVHLSYGLSVILGFIGVKLCTSPVSRSPRSPYRSLSA